MSKINEMKSSGELLSVEKDPQVEVFKITMLKNNEKLVIVIPFEDFENAKVSTIGIVNELDRLVELGKC